MHINISSPSWDLTRNQDSRWLICILNSYITGINLQTHYLTLRPPSRTIVPYANSLDPDETPSNSASHPDLSCLTLIHFHQLWGTFNYRTLQIEADKKSGRWQFILRANVQLYDVISGFLNVSEKEAFFATERAVKQVIHQLQHLKKVWQEVLPASNYRKAMGRSGPSTSFTLVAHPLKLILLLLLYI